MVGSLGKRKEKNEKSKGKKQEFFVGYSSYRVLSAGSGQAALGTRFGGWAGWEGVGEVLEGAA